MLIVHGVLPLGGVKQ